MKLAPIPVLICMFALAFAVQLAQSFGSRSGVFSSFQGDTEADTALRVEDVLCGPKSLHIAVNLLGYPVRQADIMDKCTLDQRGVSFGEIERCAKLLGVHADLRQMNWEQLLTSDCVCVLFVDKAHYVTVDARAEELKDGNVRLYDPGRVAMWIGREALEQRWAGETLSLEAPDNKGPVVFESLWKDTGFLASDSCDFRVQLSNQGETDRALKVLGTSCGCTTASLDTEMLKPGEATFLSTRVSLVGKRGSFQERVLISCDSRDAPIEIWCSGGKYADALCRPREYFDEIVTGGPFEKMIYVHDPGQEALSLDQLNCESKLRLSQTGEDVPCKFEIQPVGESDEAIGRVSQYPIKPGDYRICVSGLMPADAKPQQLEGTIEISSGLDHPLDHATIQISGRIISPISCYPSAILVGDSWPDSSSMTSLRIQNRRGGRPQLLDFKLSDSRICEVNVTENHEGVSQGSLDSRTPLNINVEIQFEAADLDQTQSTNVSAVLRIFTSDGDVDVPVIWSGHRGRAVPSDSQMIAK